MNKSIQNAWMNYVTVESKHVVLSSEDYTTREEAFILGSMASLGVVAGEIADGIRKHGNLTGAQIMDIFNMTLQEANGAMTENQKRKK